MKWLLVLISLLALFVSSGSAATLKWSGARNPTKFSAGDGVTKLGTKIGKFITLSNNAEWAQVIFNVNNRFPGSTPWVTLAVGDVPDAPARPVEAHEEFLSAMDSLGVDVFLEIFPRKTNDVLAATDAWLGKFKHHLSVKGFGVDLEYYKGVDDVTARLWDEKIKSHNPRYRMFLKHWEIGFMPPTYRSDIIFIDTSSEASVEALNTDFAKWAVHFAPSACAFQFGYPADEDGMDGKNTTGWWKLNDPIKDWGNALLAQIENPEQEIGFLWVCVKSGKTYNAQWDLTKGTTVPARKAAVPKAASPSTFTAAEIAAVISASPPPIRPSPELQKMTVLFDGRTLDRWEFNSNAWKIVDGAMRGTGRGGNIFTKSDYGSFRLIVASRVASPEGNPGRDHLGVLFWGERATNFGTGKALQVQPPHGAMWDYRTNKGLKPEHPNPRPRPRYQDWHVCEILAKFDTGEVRAAVDGVEVAKYKHPDPSVLKRGPIGMQIHSVIGVFDHKGIRVEADPKDDKLITVN